MAAGGWESRGIGEVDSLLSTEAAMGPQSHNPEIMTPAEDKSQIPNERSHPGIPGLYFLPTIHHSVYFPKHFPVQYMSKHVGCCQSGIHISLVLSSIPSMSDVEVLFMYV